MAKKSSQSATKRKKRSDTAAVIADKARLSPRQVRRIIAGDSENPKVLDAALEYEAGKNELLKKVEELLQD